MLSNINTPVKLIEREEKPSFLPSHSSEGSSSDLANFINLTDLSGAYISDLLTKPLLVLRFESA